MDGKFLYEDLDSLKKFGVLKDLSDFIEAGLSENIVLRDYQKEAFQYFITYMENEELSKNKQIHTLFHMATGSATTAHAVMKLNAEDGGNRKYIMVQLPEIIPENKPAYKAGYRTIDQIGRERIKRAAKNIKEETSADIDYGFKTFRLESLEENTLNKVETFDPSAHIIMDDMVSIFDTNYASGKETILTTWMNQDGYGLSAVADKVKLSQYEADLCENTIYIINEGLTSEDVMELIRKIESMELNITRVVVYPYSIRFNVAHELSKNLKTLRNNKTVELIERY